MRISDWSSDVCSSDLRTSPPPRTTLFSWALGSSGNQSLVSFAISRSVIRATLYVHPTSHRRRRAGCRHRGAGDTHAAASDRKSVVEGKSVSVRVDLGGGRIFRKKRKHIDTETIKIK